MKKLLAVFVLICMLLCACSEDTAPTVETFEQNTTRPTTEPVSEEPTETESTEESTPAPSAKMPSYEVLYSSVQVQRDSVGNPWLNVIVEVKNTGEEPICLTQGTILVFADDEPVLTLQEAMCYPKMLEPGQVGYFFEQTNDYVEEGAALRAELEVNMERAVDFAQVVDESSQIYASAFGVEIRGAHQAQEGTEGLLCVAAVLFDAEQKPFFVLTDYIDVTANEYTLTSDKLPEGLRMEDIASHVVYVYPYEG